MNKNYSIIGSPTQVAITETRANLAQAKAKFKPAKFSNGFAALKVISGLNKEAALAWLHRCHVALAFQAGRLGRWIIPTFTIVQDN